MSVSFSLSGVTATVQNPDLDDKLDLDPHQVVQPKASGGFYRFALAAAADTQRELRWSNLRVSELNDLAAFFENQAQGVLNEFTFTDERGAQYAAYFVNAKLEPVTVSDDAASTGSFSTGGDMVPTTLRSGGFYALTVKLHLRGGAPLTIGPTAGPTSTPTAGVTASPTAPPPDYALQSDLVVHEDLTTAAHGGIVASGDSRLTDARTPTAHASTHASTGSDPITAAGIGADADGAAAGVQGNLNTHTGLTATAHGGLIPSSAAGADNGVAQLDSSGKVPASQLPSAILGALEYQGTFDCSGGSYPAAPSKGWYFVCSVAGTIGGTAYGLGDWLVYNDSSWNRIDNQQVVSSVCGKVGAVSLGASDVSAIPGSALVTSVGSPGSDSSVPSEKAVRSALASMGNGDVTGPGSSTSGNLPSFADASGVLLQDSGIAAANVVLTSDSRLTNARTPTAHASTHAAAGSDPITAANIGADASGAAATVQGNLNTHAGLTTTAHGGIAASNDSRLSDARTPTAHESTHLTGGGDVLALTEDIEFVIDGSGSAITTGMKGCLQVDFPCTIQSATLLADQSGSVVVDIFKCTYAAFAPPTHPASGDKITSSTPPTISSATKATDSALSSWTTTISAGDILGFNVNSCTTITRVTVVLKVVRT
jgi:hypothetical protein